MIKSKVLLIVEENVLEGQSYFGTSNDLLLLHSALKAGLEVYLTTPQKLQIQNSSALKLAQPNWQKLNLIIKEIWQKEVFNSLKQIPANPTHQEKQQSKILFENSNWQKINWSEMLVFNRAEPISLTKDFYKILSDLQNAGVKILPNPKLNQALGDKLAVYAIHYNQEISGINLLQSVNFKGTQNQISFASKIIDISTNTLDYQQIQHFYQLLEQQNFVQAQKLFNAEYQIFCEGAQQYLQFHQQLENDSIIKPASYFGGVGVVVAKNQQLDFSLATKNIVQSFFAIKADAAQNNNQTLAFLPTIIVQKRASHAHLGDLRIVFCGQNLQGIFVRFNPNFEKFKVGNLHFGGYAKTLFGSYETSKDGIRQMISDLEMQGFDNNSDEIKKVLALEDLLDKLQFFAKIKIFHTYPIIGIDALLNQDSDGKYYYGINEINLTSPMGQVQLIILAIAQKIKNNPNLLDEEIEQYLQNNIADQTIKFLTQ